MLKRPPSDRGGAVRNDDPLQIRRLFKGVVADFFSAGGHGEGIVGLSDGIQQQRALVLGVQITVHRGVVRVVFIHFDLFQVAAGAERVEADKFRRLRDPDLLHGVALTEGGVVDFLDGLRQAHFQNVFAADKGIHTDAGNAFADVDLLDLQTLGVPRRLVRGIILHRAAALHKEHAVVIQQPGATARLAAFEGNAFFRGRVRF